MLVSSKQLFESQSIVTCVNSSNGFDLTGNRIVMLLCEANQWYVIGSVGASELQMSRSVTADWDGSFSNVQSALAELASRIRDEEEKPTIQYAILRDEKASGTAGGAAATATWNNRVLNTEVYDPNNIVTISSNQFTPIAGTYKLIAFAQALRVDGHRLRLFNVTDATTETEGKNSDSPSAGAGDAQMTATLIGFLVANGTDAYRIDHYTQTARATDGLGTAISTGGNEVYLEILLEKVA